MGDVKEIKATAELKLPEKVDENVGKTCRDLSQTVKKVASPVSKIAELYLIKAPCTLLAPVAAYLRGKSYEIACKYLPFQNQIEMRKELSQIKMAQFVLENLVDKEQKGEDLPPNIEDTDNLFSIQNAASETTDEDFIKFWAKLYTEEACKPNTVSKKTVNLCKDLNKDVVKALEDEIFPFCDEYGFYFGDCTKKIESINKAIEYGFLRISEQKVMLNYINVFLDIKIGQYYIYILPGYHYMPEYNGKVLTNSALEVKRCLKLQKDINLDSITPSLERASKRWGIEDRFQAFIHYKNVCPYKFFIMEKDKIVYPNELKNKNISEVCDEILNDIEYKDEAKQFMNPSGINIMLHI